MAVILGVYDPDKERRALMISRLPDFLSGLEHRSRQEASLRELNIFWEASISTPVSVATDRLGERERMAFVVGDYDAAYAAKSDAAVRLLRRTAAEVPDASCISGQNGYYFAVLFEDSPRIVLGTDVLGMFPLYYWVKGDVCIFGTSPELFRNHPSFSAEPSTYAIASILLFSHLSGGQSIYKGVFRGKPGHLVEWTPRSGANETKANPLTLSDANFDEPYDLCMERVAACFDEYHKALASLHHVDVSLSGGQDSRMVAAYVGKYFPKDAARAVSLGCDDDQELRYARKVSRVLGMQHRYEDVQYEQHLENAIGQLKLESLQGPFASFEIGNARNLLAERGCPFVSGYLGDPIIGDGQIVNATSPKTGQIEFEEALTKMRRYGFGLDDASDLLRDRNGKAAITEVIEDLRCVWDGIDGYAFQKAWLFAMMNRVRFHVGSVVWRLSLGAWPLMPYYDRRLMQAMASMPLHFLAGRRIQADIIKRKFPRLATLPLDRNAVGPDYLVIPLYRKFLPPVSDISWKLYQLLERGKERRYYHRVFEFNNLGWGAIRREAERYRQQVGDLLDATAVNRLLPEAGFRTQYTNMVAEASKVKTLVGLTLWYGLNRGLPVSNSNVVGNTETVRDS